MVLLPYELPDACETEEVAALLAALKPMPRRALRSYMHQVEFGALRVSQWFESATCPVKERRWRYLLAKPEFRAAMEAYKRALQRCELEAEEKAVADSQRMLRMATPRAARRLVDQVDADVGELFKVVERWTDAPLPSQEILQEEQREVEDGRGRTRTVRFYLVRQTVVDLERLRDPEFSRKVKRFSDSPRSGISIEMHDSQRAAESVLDRAGTETASKTPGAAATVVVIPDNGRADRADENRGAEGSTDEVPGEPG